LVIARVISLRRQDITAVEFGEKDKKDLIIPPFALLYMYLIITNAVHPTPISGKRLFNSSIVSWAGVLTCIMALVLFIWTLLSFKKSFRVGLVENRSEGLVTTGSFAISRNPTYVSFAIMLIGQFMIYPSPLLLLYIFAGVLIFHRQVIKEEKFLREQYGKEFIEYCSRVRRYL
jgi:protein-S-isoprenylcysteine O-methyltransferase Ste14